MSKNDKVININGVHGAGTTCLAFAKDGKHAFTGGQDCIVRIWVVNEGAEQEPKAVIEPTDAITCIATAKDCWIVGHKDSEVLRYSGSSGDLDSVLASVVGVPIRSLAIDPKGCRVAVTSDELTVKVIDMEDMLKTSLLNGFKAGVRRVTWSPSGSFLATCTSDGKIIIWDMEQEPALIVETIEGIIPVVMDQDSREFSYDCSAVWHTSGDYLYVATKGHEIISISRTDWKKSSTFSHHNATGSVTALALSPNGKYLASASQSKVHVWSTESQQYIISQNGNLGSTITQLEFSPQDNLIAWTDSEGGFTRWRNPIPESRGHPVSSVSTVSTTAAVKQTTGLGLFDDDKTEDVTLEEDDDAGIDEDMVDVDDSWIIEDIVSKPSEVKSADNRGTRDGFVKEMVSITQSQPPFQPGSTPMENRKRYLVYNMIGVIEVTDQETHHIVNVEFFDRSLRKGYHFTDNFKYDLGCLGERGALFACPPENDHPAEILFKPYTISKNSDWVYKLRKGTKCLGMAAGALPLTSSNGPDVEIQGYGNVVLATSENDLTFLSGSGRERRIMALGGDFVTMVAGAEWVFVIHRAGSTTIDGSQNLSYSIINFEDFSVRQRDVLPVPKGHTLKWVGLTDQGAPAMYDSTGCVHVLTKYRIPHHASWARVMDTNLLERRKGKDESYWAVGISDGNFMCLILKGRQEYPGFPRPLIQELPMRIPFRLESPQDEIVERESLNINMLLDSLDEELTSEDIVNRQKMMDKELIQLIQAACKENNIPRAIELTKLLHNNVAMDAAMKIAEFYHLVGLQEKMGMIKEDREESEDRLIAARNKRKRWLKPEPPLRELATPAAASSSRFDPLGVMRPPPPIDRPGMARVTVPVIETTRFSSRAPLVQTPERSTWDDDPTLPDSPPSTDAKRKRDEVEDSIPSSDFTMPPPKQKGNPFAKKANIEKNPFARKSEPNKMIHKSESFFAKVDAAESDPTPRKRPSAFKGKEKKEGAKQATLFGMLSKVDKAPQLKKTPDGVELESQVESQIETQATDVTMINIDDLDSQEVFPIISGWEETQVVDIDNL